MRRDLVLTPKFKRAFRKFVRHNARLQKRIKDTLMQMKKDVFAASLGTHKLSGTLKGLRARGCGYDCRIVFLLALFVAACGKGGTDNLSPTRDPAIPEGVTLGYIAHGSSSAGITFYSMEENRGYLVDPGSPIAVIDPEPGLIFTVYEITYDPGNGKLSSYKEKIRYPPGKVLELEFYDLIYGEDVFIDGYTVSINGIAIKGPSKEGPGNIDWDIEYKIKDGLGFAPIPLTQDDPTWPLRVFEPQCEKQESDDSITVIEIIGEATETERGLHFEKFCVKSQKTYNLYVFDRAYGTQFETRALTSFSVEFDVSSP